MVQRIACEGFTGKAFTQSSPFPSPQPSLYELVRSEVKGEHRKSELGEVRVRDRDVCVGACPRDENTSAGEGENREGETKGRKVRNDSVRLPRRRANSVRAIEKCATKTKKFPRFATNLPTFRKDVAFSQRVFRRHDKVQCLFTKFCTKHKAGRRNSLHFVGTSTKILYFCRKTFAAAATLCRPSPPI